jgi:glycine/D-amino acid oxidase-like deaminating enzyme
MGRASGVSRRTAVPSSVTIPTVEGFFWLAGQGGYGIQTAPAASQLAASLIREKNVPLELASFGISADAVSPRRFCKPVLPHRQVVAG